MTHLVKESQSHPWSLWLGCMVAVLPLLSSVACSPENLSGNEFVQASVDETPRWRMDINRVMNGIYRPLFPRCNDKIRPGHTVEFRNFLPEVPANVTSISAPETAALYSPNLVRPYNYVSASNPENTACADNECEPYSYWRVTFEKAGVYDWMDTNQGAPGRKVVDDYYGTVTFVGLDPNTPLATICVDDGTGVCAGVCCSSDADCVGTNRCTRASYEAVGRCQIPTE